MVFLPSLFGLIIILIFCIVDMLFCQTSMASEGIKNVSPSANKFGGGVSRHKAPQPKSTKLGKTIIFDDHPEFTPNLTPRHIFKMGSFGGTYWRPIHSSVTNKDYKNAHHEFAKYKIIDYEQGGKKVGWWDGIPEILLTQPDCDCYLNKYGVSSGTSLDYWENKGWMHPQDPYGWVQWYCRFYAGRRSDDDERQIGRWLHFAGPKGRFRLRLIHLCKSQKKSYKDFSVSPVVRQGLQHWAYILTKKDFDRSL